MGLGDIVDTDTNTDNDSGTDREFNHITVDEFEEFLSQFDYEWVRTSTSKRTPFGEYVYGTQTPIDREDDQTLFGNDTLYLTIFSTIEEASGKAREKGTDAIRTVIWDNSQNCAVGGEKKTLRIKTWEKNLRKKIENLASSWSEKITRCDECGGYMVKREGEYGEFYGCTAYPRCDNTKQIGD